MNIKPRVKAYTYANEPFLLNEEIVEKYHIPAQIIPLIMAGDKRKLKGRIHYNISSDAGKKLIKYGKNGLITKGTLLSKFQATEADLEKLECYEVKNPHYSQSCMYLYYHDEAASLFPQKIKKQLVIDKNGKLRKQALTQL